MKRKNLLLILSVLAFLSSCQSEYENQFEHAKKLVHKERHLLNNMEHPNTASSYRHMLESIREELSFRAHLSGNEELFNKEVSNYRKNYKINRSEGLKLISKYP